MSERTVCSSNRVCRIRGGSIGREQIKGFDTCNAPAGCAWLPRGARQTWFAFDFRPKTVPYSDLYR